MKQRIGIDYDFLFHSLPRAYTILLPDDPVFTIVEMSEAAAELSPARSRDELVNHPLLKAYPLSRNKESQAGTQALLASLRRCIENAKPDDVGMIRYDIQTKKGSFEQRYWKTINYPIIRHGKVMGIILSTEDITEAYNNQLYAKQRIEYLEHLVAVNESKDEFISVASHQLRTPATGVKQYLSMLLSGMFGELPKEHRDIIERAHDSNERQLKIVSDLLKVAQVDAGKLTLRKEETDVNLLTRQVIQDQAASFQKRNQVVEFVTSKRPADVMLDPTIIRMVIENIVDNASKYTKDGGRIKIRVIRRKEDVKIIVRDEGVGISTHQLNKLFEKFSRIDNELSTKVGGTGLGLYWAKKSIELHGGRLVYEPARPQGSIFTILLPKV